jgi:hypothetical protein
MTLSMQAEPHAGPDHVEGEQLAVFAYLREVWYQHGPACNDAALAVQTRLYSVWDDPAPDHDHAPRQSVGWPLVVCKEGSD